jgi:hypothetical protein
MSITLERRMATGTAEVRAAERAGTPSRIIGYGAPFNVESIIRVPGGVSFREKILPGAFRNVLTSDARCLFNHDKNMPLGRVSNGTLRLSEDSRGLRYEVDVNPADTAAVNVAARVQRGDVSGSSFGFLVAPGGDSWTRPTHGDELPLREIREIRVLEDVGPVVFPAYAEASAEARDAAAAAAAGSGGGVADADRLRRLRLLQLSITPVNERDADRLRVFHLAKLSAVSFGRGAAAASYRPRSDADRIAAFRALR